jgi:hypothetical protein
MRARGGGGRREEQAPAAARPPLLEPSAPPPAAGGFGPNSAAVERFLDGLARLGPEHFRDIAAWAPGAAGDPNRDERIDDFNQLVRHVREYAAIQPRIGEAILVEVDMRTQRAGIDLRPKVARLAWLAAVAIAFSASLPVSDRRWLYEPFLEDIPD